MYQYFVIVLEFFLHFDLAMGRNGMIIETSKMDSLTLKPSIDTEIKFPRALVQELFVKRGTLAHRPLTFKSQRFVRVKMDRHTRINSQFLS